MKRFPQPMSRRAFIRLSSFALGASIISACAPAAPAEKEQAVPVIPDPASAIDPSPEVAIGSTATVEPATAVPTTVTAPAAQSVDRPFAATDPGSVVLAAGRPQLVEFFAGW